MLYNRAINVFTPNGLCQLCLKVIHLKNNVSCKDFKRTCFCVWELNMIDILSELRRISIFLPLYSPLPKLFDSTCNTQLIPLILAVKVYNVLLSDTRRNSAHSQRVKERDQSIKKFLHKTFFRKSRTGTSV